uniref:Uncharacterized protein n=1 Tax=Oryza brachyantha TaxID=4533 RepID=J3MLF8_ORYBR
MDGMMLPSSSSLSSSAAAGCPAYVGVVLGLLAAQAQAQGGRWVSFHGRGRERGDGARVVDDMSGDGVVVVVVAAARARERREREKRMRRRPGEGERETGRGVGVVDPFGRGLAVAIAR